MALRVEDGQHVLQGHGPPAVGRVRTDQQERYGSRLAPLCKAECCSKASIDPHKARSGTKYVIDSLVDTARPSFCTHLYTIQGISIMALSCQVPAKLQLKITPLLKTISNYLVQVDFCKTFWYKVQLINFTCELAEAYRLSRVLLYAAGSINVARTDSQYFHGFADKKMSSNEHSLFSLISSAFQ